MIDRLVAHGVKFTRLDRAATLDVATYRFSNAVWEAKPFEGHHSIKYDLSPVTEKMTFAPGSVVVDTAQPLGRVIVNLLEPAAPDALVRWGYMDSCFEQKEYFENYALEGVIRKMLADSPELAADSARRRRTRRWPIIPTRSGAGSTSARRGTSAPPGSTPSAVILGSQRVTTLPLNQGRS